MTTERIYALTRLKAGDYLLPSNDGLTLLRIARYDDYRAADVLGIAHPWGVWRWMHYISDTAPSIDPDDWEAWRMIVSDCATRAKAIEAAMEL